MKKRIIPSIIAETQKELEERYKKIKPYVTLAQLDIMDGKFVKNKSLNFDFTLPKQPVKFEAHLMIEKPNEWIKKNYKKANTIIFHIETTKKPKETIKLIRTKKRKVGIAIKPETNIETIVPYLEMIDQVTILTVQPGRYGAPFKGEQLKKVREIRKYNKKIPIEVDGGITPKTIQKTKKAGTTYISGNYLQKQKNLQEGLRILRNKIE
jgi:ribulose-phosphate 3-epimerase